MHRLLSVGEPEEAKKSEDLKHILQTPPRPIDRMELNQNSSNSSSLHIPSSQDCASDSHVVLQYLPTSNDKLSHSLYQLGDDSGTLTDDKVNDQNSAAAFCIENFYDVEAQCNDDSQHYEHTDTDDESSASLVYIAQTFDQSRNNYHRLNQISPKIKIGGLHLDDLVVKYANEDTHRQKRRRLQ